MLAAAVMPTASTAADDDCGQADVSTPILRGDTLDVLTLNVGHGRGTALNQLLVTRSRHRRNLDAIAAMLLRTGADVVALQEADAPSLWSGRFDHVTHLADAARFPCTIHGHHAEGWLYTFGAALLSPFAMTELSSHAFRPSPPTPTKGFVRGTVHWHSGGADRPIRPVTLVSVHLDYSRRSVRDAQIAEMNGALSDLSSPLILLGDLNEDWTASDSAVRRIARDLGLRPYRPTAPEFGTYKRTNRLDWILISEELEFVDYAVLPDIVSDHRALMARIGWAASP